MPRLIAPLAALMCLLAGCFHFDERALVGQAAATHVCDAHRVQVVDRVVEENVWMLDVCGEQHNYTATAGVRGFWEITSGPYMSPGIVGDQYATERGDYVPPPSPQYVPPSRDAPVYGAPPSGRVQVRGYTRRDGTYVRPHTRSRPH